MQKTWKNRKCHRIEFVVQNEHFTLYLSHNSTNNNDFIFSQQQHSFIFTSIALLNQIEASMQIYILLSYHQLFSSFVVADVANAFEKKIKQKFSDTHSAVYSQPTVFYVFYMKFSHGFMAFQHQYFLILLQQKKIQNVVSVSIEIELVVRMYSLIALATQFFDLKM